MHQNQITHCTAPNISPVEVARDLWAVMDDAYNEEISHATAKRILSAMFDYVAPHYQAIYNADPVAAENVANCAEWLDRLDQLADIV